MDITNPDLSHISFLNEAENDIISAKVLLEAKQYPQAIYFFQQSIEKSCKYFGLTIKSINYDELNKISHEPQKIFYKIFNSGIFSSVDGNSIYNTFKEQFFKQDINERAKAAYYCIETESKKEDTENGVDFYSDQLLAFYESNPFNELLPPNFIFKVKSQRGTPLFENQCKESLQTINDSGKCLVYQIIMSFLVNGVEANSRYPDYKQKTTPSGIYSNESVIVKNLSYFIEKQNFCIPFLRRYFTPL
jgi:hypothetical protein